MVLFTVEFETRASVIKYDKRGKEISRSDQGTPIKLTALPYSAAMSYSHADNFVMYEYVPENQPRYASKGPGRVDSIGNGTKVGQKRNATSQVSSVKNNKSSDAITGNMAGAINA